MVTPGREHCDQRAGADHALAERRREPGPVHRHLWIYVHCDFAYPETEPRDYKSQAHHRNACPNPSEKCALVGENLRFDLIGIELPFLCPELLSVLLDSDILSQFGFAAGPDVAQSVSET